MKQVSQSSKIKTFIVIGYLLLILLAIYGVVRIYSELRKFSEYDRPFEERKELVLISNTLATLYESESMSRMLFSNISQKKERYLYDSLIHKIHNQIDTFKSISTEVLMHERLDSVAWLLDLKHKNAAMIFQLMDSINRAPMTQKSMNTILSKKDIDNLGKIYKMQMLQKQDTTIVEVKKKSFAQRFSDVFKSQVKDSMIVKKNAETLLTDSILPHEVLSDTIVQFMTETFLDYDKKREIYIARLVHQQNLMYSTNSELTGKVNAILRELELREYAKIEKFSLEKERALKESYEVALQVALSALITAIVFLILSMNSLSREQKYRRQLENAKKYAEDLLKSRERLMLAISHDIKTPLSSIIGYIELLTKRKLPAKEKYYLDNMQSSSEHILELVTNLLDYHRLESGKQEVNIMHFSPCRLLNDVHQSFLPLTARKGLDFEFANDLKPDQFYQSDPVRIRQVVNNLLSNAVKFTDKGKITLSASVYPSRKGDILNISVKDTGRGIDPASQEKIFEEFNRIQSVEADGVEGAGLGLAISRKLVLLLKGDIRVKSEEGIGSEFTVNITLVSNTPKTPRHTFESGRKNKLNVLFVDDDQVLLNMYAEFLLKEGFVSARCNNSLEALRLLQDKRFDIVFSDIQMPDMNGFELVERIRLASFKGAKEMPVIALSARLDISQSQLSEAGFSGFLAKPFSSNQLLDVITRYTGVVPKEKTTLSGEGFSALTAFAGKDKEAARDIIKTFVQENVTTVKNIEEALSSEDWNSIWLYAHKLLPLMRMIEAGEIVSILYELENNARDEKKIQKLIEMIRQKNKEAENFLKTMDFK